jgi:hypothetical protein
MIFRRCRLLELTYQNTRIPEYQKTREALGYGFCRAVDLPMRVDVLVPDRRVRSQSVFPLATRTPQKCVSGVGMGKSGRKLRGERSREFRHEKCENLHCFLG